MSRLREKEQRPSSPASSVNSGRQGGGARRLLEEEIYKREREVLALKITLNELRRDVAGAALNLLEISGALEEALRSDRPQAILELRRLVSRIKGLV